MLMNGWTALCKNFKLIEALVIEQRSVEVAPRHFRNKMKIAQWILKLFWYVSNEGLTSFVLKFQVNSTRLSEKRNVKVDPFISSHLQSRLKKEWLF